MPGAAGCPADMEDILDFDHLEALGAAIDADAFEAGPAVQAASANAGGVKQEPEETQQGSASRPGSMLPPSRTPVKKEKRRSSQGSPADGGESASGVDSHEEHDDGEASGPLLWDGGSLGMPGQYASGCGIGIARFL